MKLKYHYKIPKKWALPLVGGLSTLNGSVALVVGILVPDLGWARLAVLGLGVVFVGLGLFVLLGSAKQPPGLRSSDGSFAPSSETPALQAYGRTRQDRTAIKAGLAAAVIALGGIILGGLFALLMGHGFGLWISVAGVSAAIAFRWLWRKLAAMGSTPPASDPTTRV